MKQVPCQPLKGMKMNGKYDGNRAAEGLPIPK
jgi:hypothetical protein